MLYFFCLFLFGSFLFLFASLQVHGYENATGTFGLSLTEIEPPPSYDSCLTAAGPIPYDIIFSVPFTIQTSVDASTLGCGNTVDSLFSVPGIWISVLADGGTITASIDCSEEETNDDDDDFRIYVLQGDCSVGLECIDSSSIGQCSISWMSEESETYYLFVSIIITILFVCLFFFVVILLWSLLVYLFISVAKRILRYVHSKNKKNTRVYQCHLILPKPFFPFLTSVRLDSRT